MFISLLRRKEDRIGSLKFTPSKEKEKEKKTLPRAVKGRRASKTSENAASGYSPRGERERCFEKGRGKGRYSSWKIRVGFSIVRDIVAFVIIGVTRQRSTGSELDPNEKGRGARVRVHEMEGVVWKVLRLPSLKFSP